MSICNYCIYKRIEEDAKKQEKRVVCIPSIKMGAMGGMEIHMLKKWEKPNKKNWRAWMMEITDSCCC